MDKRNIELFAANYPKSPAKQGTTSHGTMRTPLRDVMSEEGFYSPKHTATSKQYMSTEAKQGTKKFLAILLITLIGAFIYSAFSYTLSDSLFGKMNIEFFDKQGSPGTAIIVIHSIIFFIIVHIILGALKWWQ